MFCNSLRREIEYLDFYFENEVPPYCFALEMNYLISTASVELLVWNERGEI